MFAGAVHSIPGNRYGDLNQDNSFVFNGETSADGESGCWAVFDGHGVLGEYASRIAASTIELLLTEPNDLLEGQTHEEEMASAFLYAHQNICSSYNVAPKEYDYGPRGQFELQICDNAAYYVSKENPDEREIVEYGTTVVTAWKVKDQLIIGWCGDSRAVIGGLTRDGDPSSLTVELLTPVGSHTLRNSEERARFEEAMKSNPVLGIEDDGYARIGDTVLDMTRALGHVDLSPQPSVKRLTLEQHHQVLILATDGVWDHLSEEDAIKIALENEDAQSAAENIITVACALNRDQKDQDNATVIVVFFDLE